jgi:hypothetical protein
MRISAQGYIYKNMGKIYFYVTGPHYCYFVFYAQSVQHDNAKLHEVEGQHSQNCNKRTLSISLKCFLRMLCQSKKF